MSLELRRDTIRSWGLPAVAALAAVLVGANIDSGGNWLRLRAMPREERQRLIDNLQKFDLLYSADQQRSLRDLDRQINELDPPRQAQYLAALRRYHNWLNQLPENKQSELKEKPPAERMTLVKKLVADQPVPPALPARFLQFVDVGDYSPLELAAIYHIWQGLSQVERQHVEKMLPGSRRQNLLKIGEKKKIVSELNPEQFDEEKSIAALKSWLRAHRPALLNLLADDTAGAEILRRQAINYHFLMMKDQIKSVTPDHLAEFLASFPPWLRSSFDHYPPEEARRRLTVVYRLVFPAGVEIGVRHSPPPAPAAGAHTKSAPIRKATKPAGAAPAAPGNSPF